jgi:hypothetical protein
MLQSRLLKVESYPCTMHAGSMFPASYPFINMLAHFASAEARQDPASVADKTADTAKGALGWTTQFVKVHSCAVQLLKLAEELVLCKVAPHVPAGIVLVFYTQPPAQLCSHALQETAASVAGLAGQVLGNARDDTMKVGGAASIQRPTLMFLASSHARGTTRKPTWPATAWTTCSRAGVCHLG